MAAIVAEFFGVARLRTGVALWETTADTLGALVAQLQIQYPDLAPLLDQHILLNINGERFTRDLTHTLQDADHVLVMGADIGG
jgi:molybdopterin converting factor small subunit